VFKRSSRLPWPEAHHCSLRVVNGKSSLSLASRVNRRQPTEWLQGLGYRSRTLVDATCCRGLRIRGETARTGIFSCLRMADAAGMPGRRGGILLGSIQCIFGLPGPGLCTINWILHHQCSHRPHVRRREQRSNKPYTPVNVEWSLSSFTTGQARWLMIQQAWVSSPPCRDASGQAHAIVTAGIYSSAAGVIQDMVGYLVCPDGTVARTRRPVERSSSSFRVKLLAEACLKAYRLDVSASLTSWWWRN
jgi:hypothetical protein